MDRQEPKLAQPSTNETPLGETQLGQSRRAALAKLGLGVAIAYSAPVILKIEKPARANTPISVCPPGGGNPGGPPLPAPPGCPPTGGVPGP